MALIECKKCGAKISDKATACPKCNSLMTVELDSKEQFTKVSSLFFLLTSIVAGIYHAFCLFDIDCLDWTISAVLSDLVLLGLYLLVFTYALNRLNGIPQKIVLTILTTAAISFIYLVLCDFLRWIFYDEILVLIISRIHIIILIISFVILAIKSKGSAMKIACSIQILLRVMMIINVYVMSKGGQLSNGFYVYNFIYPYILCLISAIFFVLSTRKISEKTY